MSGQGDGFKHIKVTAAEEEDTVIQAGLSVDAPDAGREPGSSHRQSSSAEPVRKRAPQDARQGQDHAAGEELRDDLDVPSMPIAQRIVIIAAIVLIIVALVYYFTVMR